MLKTEGDDSMNELERDDMIKFVEDIKNDIISTRNNIIRNANRDLMAMYFRIGKCISVHASYGSNFINTLSACLR